MTNNFTMILDSFFEDAKHDPNSKAYKTLVKQIKEIGCRIYRNSAGKHNVVILNENAAAASHMTYHNFIMSLASDYHENYENK